MMKFRTICTGLMVMSVAGGASMAASISERDTENEMEMSNQVDQGTLRQVTIVSVYIPIIIEIIIIIII